MISAHWLSRGGGHDAGFADLQTDVMRFMAILAFCLMAVFALVQSMPLNPEPPPASAEPPPAPVVSTTATPATVATAPANAGTKATPVPAAPVTVPSMPPAAEPASKTRPAAPVPAKAAAPSAPTADAVAASANAATQGVTLRFSSDAALRRLVARGKVGLFAFSKGQSWRLAPSLAEDSFRAANAPGEYHSMAAATVPDAVTAALFEQTDADSRSVTWGVTLPLPTRYAIARLVREFDSGALVIGSDGRVSRETP